MNLSPGRLAVLVALVVGGIAVMMNGFGDDGGTLAAGASGLVQTTPGQTASPSGGASTPSSTETPADLEPQVEGVVVQVLNGTDAAGLAGQVDLLLENKGYEMTPEPGDLIAKPVPTSVVYFRAGSDPDQSRVDAENLATTYLKGVDASVKPLNDALDEESAVATDAQLVVVLGEDYAEAHPVA